MNFEQAVNLLQTQVDWESFFALRSVMAGEMNKPSERFFKSGIIERGLCSYSNGILSYIDEPGRDCQFTPLVGQKSQQTSCHAQGEKVDASAQ